MLREEIWKRLHSLEAINKNGGPIFKQLAKIVIQRLIRCELQPGDKLAPTKEFALTHLVNPNTVVACYKELIQLGIAETRRGRGTFIRNDAPVDSLRKEAMKTVIETFVRDIDAIGARLDEAIDVIRRGSS